MPGPGMTAEGRQPLCDFIRENKEDVLAEWEAEVRRYRIADAMSEPRLRDHLPQLLEEVARVTQSAHEGAVALMGESPETHALDRLGEGFDLSLVTREYALLRQCVFRLYGQRLPGPIDLDEISRFDLALDEAINVAVSRYARTRQRTLEALDRISSAALEEGDLEALLPKLLRVILETTASVDSAVLLLRDGELLRVRAAVGLLEGRGVGFTLPVGEGFAGTIAQTGKPLALRYAATDPLVASEYLKARDIRALYGVPLLHEGKVIGVAHMGSATAWDFSKEDQLLFRTMTHRAASIIIRAELIRRERESLAQLRHAAAFRDRLLGIVSHDLRSPLSAIFVGAQSLLRRDDAPQWARSAGSRIMRSAERMSRMISDLLDFTRIAAAGGLPIERKPVDLREVVTEILEEFEESHPGRIRADLPPDELEGSWDADRIAQVISNLVRNAFDHGSAEAPVEVSLRDEGDQVRLSVSNRGTAIPPEALPTLFDPFRRASGGKAKQGLGLGLHIVYEAVKAHGGRVEVRSDAERTTFTVDLPKLKL